jgi:zinc/manganese transport system substrate-binding protein
MKNLKFTAIALAALITLTGCAASTPEATSTERTGKLQIVASTNVWGDIANQVGGDLVEVTSIIDNASKDPHSYEATARDQIAIKNADLIVANGGGYDDFIDTMASAADNTNVLHATDNVTAVDPSVNEHVWFSIAGVAEVATAIGQELAKADAEHAATYEQNAVAFGEKIAALTLEVQDLKTITDGYTYFSTEPLALWLLADLGFKDLTPADFSEAIENETDVSPLVMQDSLDLVASGQVKYLVVNLQTENTQTQQIVDAARDSEVRAVVMTEVLPEGSSYFDWMTANLKTINPGT